VGAFNRACIEGSVPRLIRVNEGFHEKSIGQIADRIVGSGSGTRIVCIAGPSSSGKTTFIERLKVQLHVDGKNPIGVSLDDYYRDRERTPRDEKGELDFEALHALDLPLLNEHLLRLLSGEPVRLARYDFATGTSRPSAGAELALGRDDLLMLEGIHALNPELLGESGRGRAFRIFVCPLGLPAIDELTRVHGSDLRLLRRIVRDRHTRATNAEQSILRWPSVRRGERAHIFPFQHLAEAVFDSSLLYELSVLKVFAERYLLEVPQTSTAYPTAFRLLALLDRVVTIYPDHVPQTSILREFIGASGFEY
jgi:uridine kinase